jgi:hypothetical protein
MFHGVYGVPESKRAHIRKIRDGGGCSPEGLVTVGGSDVDATEATQIGCALSACASGASRDVFDLPGVRVAKLETLPELIAGLSALTLKTKEKYGDETK